MPVISIQQVWHAYGRGTPVETASLSGLTLEAGRGELLALVGPPGSGKSTVLQLLNGLLLPDRGRVLVDGSDTSHKKVRKNLWIKVGLVMQYPEKQFFEESVYQEVSFGPRNLGLPVPEIHRRVGEALDMVGFDSSSAERLSPFRLSGGEQRRVALASVLAIKPVILALDEPTAGIDPGGRRKIFDALRRLKSGQGITVIMATHSMDDAAALADRVVVLNGGQAVLTGRPREVFSNSRGIREAGLELPFPCEVINRLKKAGFGIDSMPLTLEEAAGSIFSHIKKRESGIGN